MRRNISLVIESTMEMKRLERMDDKKDDRKA